MAVTALPNANGKSRVRMVEGGDGHVVLRAESEVPVVGIRKRQGNFLKQGPLDTRVDAESKPKPIEKHIELRGREGEDHSRTIGFETHVVFREQ